MTTTKVPPTIVRCAACGSQANRRIRGPEPVYDEAGNHTGDRYVRQCQICFRRMRVVTEVEDPLPASAPKDIEPAAAKPKDEPQPATEDEPTSKQEDEPPAKPKRKRSSSGAKRKRTPAKSSA